MLSKTMEDALNRQINRELYSSYLYLGMSAWFETQNLKGFAGWMLVQSGEERNHANEDLRLRCCPAGNGPARRDRGPEGKMVVRRQDLRRGLRPRTEGAPA